MTYDWRLGTDFATRVPWFPFCASRFPVTFPVSFPKPLPTEKFLSAQACVVPD
jgi:hypothetical protein